METPPIPPEIDGQLLYRGVRDLEHGVPVTASFYRHADSGLVFQYPIPSAQQLRSYYPLDYRPHTTGGLLHRLKLLQAGLICRALAAELPPRDRPILEIGCGGGHLVMQLRREGYRDLTASDWNEDIRAQLEAQGIEFASGDIEQDLDIPRKFDRIILNNVIEHLADPAKAIRRLKVLLQPHGRILVLTPNERSLSHRLFRRHWSGLHSPRHVWIFNPGSLASLAQQEGFDVRCRLLPDPSSWAVSFQNLVRSQLRPPASSRSQPFSGWAATSWYTLAILPVCIVPALVEHAFAMSSSMLVILSAR